METTEVNYQQGFEENKPRWHRTQRSWLENAETTATPGRGCDLILNHCNINVCAPARCAEKMERPLSWHCWGKTTHTDLHRGPAGPKECMYTRYTNTDTKAETYLWGVAVHWNSMSLTWQGKTQTQQSCWHSAYQSQVPGKEWTWSDIIPSLSENRVYSQWNSHFS